MLGMSWVNLMAPSCMRAELLTSLSATCSFAAISPSNPSCEGKFDVIGPAEMGSVITTESAQEMELKVGDEVKLIVKAVHVMPVKE